MFEHGLSRKVILKNKTDEIKLIKSIYQEKGKKGH